MTTLCFLSCYMQIDSCYVQYDACFKKSCMKLYGCVVSDYGQPLLLQLYSQDVHTSCWSRELTVLIVSLKECTA